MKLSTEDRFWAKVDKSGGPGACWEWKACSTRQGYGQFWIGWRLTKAHRYAYELANGAIPEGEGCHGACILHRCDNPACVNPAHLFLGTQADNVEDKVAKGRQSRLCGERNGQAKLTEAQVSEIRAAYTAGGVLQRELGARFGVSFQQIHRIVRGKTWKVRV